MEAVEALRRSYRPQRITTLFVGESAPFADTFFYDGSNSMLRYMQRATESVLNGDGNFLDRFKANGWYLDDLVLTPVNKMVTAERRMHWKGSQDSLRSRIAEYRPLAIVSLLTGIRSIVEQAAVDAGSSAQLYAVPFPGMGNQARFHAEMLKILPDLPRL
jgi:hypothetical protein